MADIPLDDLEITEAMIESGGELLHTLFAEAGDLDRDKFRYAAERVFLAMLEAGIEEEANHHAIDSLDDERAWEANR